MKLVKVLAVFRTIKGAMSPIRVILRRQKNVVLMETQNNGPGFFKTTECTKTFDAEKCLWPRMVRMEAACNFEN